MPRRPAGEQKAVDKSVTLAERWPMSKNSHKDVLFNTQVGVSATVQRQTVGPERAAVPNLALAQLGLACHPSPTTDTKYMGSAAVHIYWHEGFEQIWFVSQTQPLDLYRCPEGLASKAITDLITSIKKMYGRRAGKLRSGF